MPNPIAQLRRVQFKDKQYNALVFWCPGCERQFPDGTPYGGLHMLPVEEPGEPRWTFNGNLEAPTLSPSILTHYGPAEEQEVCHSFMVDGVMQFLGDCTHKYANQNVPLPPLPDWVMNEV